MTLTLSQPVVSAEVDQALPPPLAARGARRARANVLLSYGLPCLAALSAFATWIRAGHFFAAGDVGPFIYDSAAHEWPSLWTHQVTGAGSTSYGVGRTFELVLLRVVAAVGGSEVLAQQVLYAVLFAGIAVSAVFLVRAFSDRVAPAVVAGLVAAFNPYVLLSLPNPLSLTVLTIASLVAGVVLRAARARRLPPIAFALPWVGASYVALNPPLLAILCGWTGLVVVGARVLVGPGGTRRAARFVLRAVPWALALNLWWLVPFVLFNFAGVAGANFTAVTDVTAWSWSHARNSPANVTTLTAHWGWNHREFFPYTSALDQPPWAWLRWFLPAAALSAPLITRGRVRHAALALIALALLLVFVGKGLHAPSSGINLWLYEHVPAFWLLREPTSKIGAPLVLTYAVLIALAVDGLLRRFPRGSRGRRFVVVPLLAAVLGMVAFPRPLWTGEVIADQRYELPATHVAVPDYWRAAADAVNQSPRPGKAVLLPLDPYYQVTTTWGYHGVDTLAQQLLTRPVIQRLPGGYFADRSGFDSLVGALETALVSDDIEAVPRLLQALGVSHVLLRHDLVAALAELRFVEPERLQPGLDRSLGLRLAGRFGDVDVYENDGPAAPVWVAGEVVGLKGPSANLSASIASLGAEQVALRGALGRVDAFSWQVSGSRESARVDLARSAGYRLSRRATAGAVYAVRVRTGPEGSALELTDSSRLLVDGEPLQPRPPMLLPLPAPDAIAVEVDGRFATVGRSDSYVSPGGRATVVAYRRSAPGSLLGPLSSVGDCHDLDTRSANQAALSATQSGDVVRLSARSHSACVHADLGAVNPGATYGLRLEHRTLAGRPARVCVWQVGPDRCADLAKSGGGNEWSRHDVFFRPTPDTTSLRVFLYADGPDRGEEETITEYKGMELFALEKVLDREIEPPAAVDEERALTEGVHDFVFEQPSLGPVAGTFSPVQDCYATDERRPRDVGLAGRVTSGDEIELSARAHSSCVFVSVPAFGSSSQYRLRVGYRTRQGRPARICVWQDGPNECARLPDLQASNDWTQLDTLIEPLPGTTALRVYLYADGEARGTVIDYRDLEVRPAVPTTLVVTQAQTERRQDKPTIDWERIDSSHYRVRVQDARGPFVLAFSDSYAAGWELQGAPSEHVEVDGYANGWRIAREGDYSLMLEYMPSRWSRLALAASMLTVLLAAGFFLVGRVRGRQPRRGTR